nr:SIMPL domain-containing protein [Acidobacteriota bacterium]
PLITVTGQAEVKVAPDEVVFNLEVETLNKELASAKALNDESVRRVLALARKYEIPARNVQTDYISVVPKYYEASGPEDRSRNREFLGYEVSKRIVIILSDVSRTESLLSDVLTTGVNYVRGVEFRSTQIRKAKDQARMLAIRAAQEKAIALTREIGQTIGKAFSIREEEPGSYDNRSRSNNFVISGGGATASADETTIALGQISIQARVVVSFELK